MTPPKPQISSLLDASGSYSKRTTTPLQLHYSLNWTDIELRPKVTSMNLIKRPRDLYSISPLESNDDSDARDNGW